MDQQADNRATAGPPGAAPGPFAVMPGVGLSYWFRDPRARDAVRLLGLGLSIWASLRGLGPARGRAGDVALAGIGLAGLGWLGWIAAGSRRWLVTASLAVMTAAGGAAAGAGSTGLIFVGFAAAGAAFAFELLPAVAIALVAVPAFAISAGSLGLGFGRLSGVCIVVLAGLLLAGGRRQVFQRARGATMLATAQREAEVATRASNLAAERNRLGREIHDVLAHTLGAVSIRLMALDAQVTSGGDVEDLHTDIEAIHALVGEGLDEARLAVQALRGDTPPLMEQLRPLCQLHGADLEATGAVPELRAEVALALYRTVQESLTNAAKHAPGAAVAVRVEERADRLQVSVRNGVAACAHSSPLACRGSGYGLVGLRERIALAGGESSAGPVGDGWLVCVEVPV